ncbi:MAG TPA: methylated-DNA--[protein]-cysteine S-methyltransferase [Acidimicrobiales bacterium]|jgi:methylated-DNA-[protein]-cysteine S-methyltransferase|nr:methylated-DNA--[protein]-cysteine S-methyltransferase [Acidimicrobiales bacterium]
METFLAHVPSPVGPFGVEGTDDAVTAIYLPNQRRRASTGTPPRAVARCALQLAEYFKGTRRDFDVSLAQIDATDFQHDVWDALTEIPYGEVRTYGDVAVSVDRPLASRAVGNANHANPWPVVVPCHRVVSSTGIGGYGGGDEVKRFLLDLEGVHY